MRTHALRPLARKAHENGDVIRIWFLPLRRRRADALLGRRRRRGDNLEFVDDDRHNNLLRW
jgi:hypothetical protein